MTLQSFKKMQELLPKNFIRVHKSYIVNLSKIEQVERSLIKIGKNFIPVSETYRDNFFKILNK